MTIFREQENVNKNSFFPEYIMIETVMGCNARCPTCGPALVFGPNNSFMNDVLYNKITGEILENKESIKKILFYFRNEPLLDPKLFTRIAFFKKETSIVTNIASNASLLTKAKAHELIESGLDEVYITIDSLNEVEFSQKKGGLNLKKVISNIDTLLEVRQRAQKSRLKVRIQTISSSPKPEDTNAEFLEYWKMKLSPGDEIAIQALHNWGGNIHTDDLFNNIEPCPFINNSLVISSSGITPLCCADVFLNYPTGDINISSIREVWQGTQFSDIRRDHSVLDFSKFKACTHCNIWRHDKRILHVMPQGPS